MCDGRSCANSIWVLTKLNLHLQIHHYSYLLQKFEKSGCRHWQSYSTIIGHRWPPLWDGFRQHDRSIGKFFLPVKEIDAGTKIAFTTY